jgi:hemolysin D
MTSSNGILRELLGRYLHAWRNAWQRRRSLDAPILQSHEVQFLPAAQALQESPVHPAPRYIQWTIIAFACLAVTWAIVGKIDVVASAEGRIVPSDQSKVIQSHEVAVVKAIHARDGQSVRAGDVLVELDASLTGADLERLNDDLLAAQVDTARARIMLEAIDRQRAPADITSRLPQANLAQQQAANEWLHSQHQELRSNLAQSEAIISRRNAEIHAAQQSAATLAQMLPLTQRITSDYAKLAGEGLVSKHHYLTKLQELMEQERQLAERRSNIVALNASRQEAVERKQGTLTQYRRTVFDLLHQNERRATSLQQELVKAERRDTLTRLTAPVDGTVQQLAVHTAGGVVTAAQPLMVIVPTDQALEIEAQLKNKDVGFVRAGQAVSVKVETFNFTKYGILHGTVLHVSQDAINDERQGTLYSLRIQLQEKHVRVGNENVPLTPGMTVRAEIKTDRQRVIDYFLSPFKKYTAESLHER